MLGSPTPPDSALGGTAYTLSVSGTAFLFETGARATDDAGRRLAPVDVVLQTDARNPAAKHAILEMYAAHGLQLPDTPTMALHRGRRDLLEDHLRRDSRLLNRRFSHREIYPAEMGCGDPIDAVVGTPLDGTTLLHMAVEYRRARHSRLAAREGRRRQRARGGRREWLRRLDAALFHGGVAAEFLDELSGARAVRRAGGRKLLAGGADPNHRGSIWKQLGHGHDETMARHEYRDVTALSWGRRFHAPIFVSEPAMRLIEAAGGVE